MRSSGFIVWSVLALWAAACSGIEVGLEGRPCQTDGDCIAGFLCNPFDNTCAPAIASACGTGICAEGIVTGSPCGNEGAVIPCSEGSGCAAGCRACRHDGTWSRCARSGECAGGVCAAGDGTGSDGHVAGDPSVGGDINLAGDETAGDDVLRGDLAMMDGGDPLPGDPVTTGDRTPPGDWTLPGDWTPPGDTRACTTATYAALPGHDVAVLNFLNGSNVVGSAMMTVGCIRNATQTGRHYTGRGFISFPTQSIPLGAEVMSASVSACHWSQKAVRGDSAFRLHSATFPVPVAASAFWTTPGAERAVLSNTLAGWRTVSVSPGAVNEAARTQFMLVADREFACRSAYEYRRFSTSTSSGDENGNPVACSGSIPWRLSVGYCLP